MLCQQPARGMNALPRHASMASPRALFLSATLPLYKDKRAKKDSFSWLSGHLLCNVSFIYSQTYRHLMGDATNSTWEALTS